MEKKLGKMFTGPTCKLLLGFTFISDVYRSSFENKTTFIKYCLTQWISKLLRELWNPLSKAVPDKFLEGITLSRNLIFCGICIDPSARKLCSPYEAWKKKNKKQTGQYDDCWWPNCLQPKAITGYSFGMVRKILTTCVLSIARKVCRFFM